MFKRYESARKGLRAKFGIIRKIRPIRFAAILRRFCGEFVGQSALDRLTHCKDECFIVTKAPEPVCSFCSEFAVILQICRLTHWKEKCLSATKRQNPFAFFCIYFAFILLRPYLAHDRLTHCKDECSSAMKSAKSRRVGPPKKTLNAKGLALSENLGLRRLVLEDCVRRQSVSRQTRAVAPPDLWRRRPADPSSFTASCALSIPLVDTTPKSLPLNDRARLARNAPARRSECSAHQICKRGVPQATAASRTSSPGKIAASSKQRTGGKSIFIGTPSSTRPSTD